MEVGGFVKALTCKVRAKRTLLKLTAQMKVDTFNGSNFISR
jgi:hypothetical protein